MPEVRRREWRDFKQEGRVHCAFYSPSFGFAAEDGCKLGERDDFGGNHHSAEQRQSGSKYVKVRLDICYSVSHTRIERQLELWNYCFSPGVSTGFPGFAEIGLHLVSLLQGRCQCVKISLSPSLPVRCLLPMPSCLGPALWPWAWKFLLLLLCNPWTNLHNWTEFKFFIPSQRFCFLLYSSTYCTSFGVSSTSGIGFLCLNFSTPSKPIIWSLPFHH